MLGFAYLSVIGVAALLTMRRQLHRLRKGDEPRCGQCEYNLTGNVSGQCPECGGLLQDVGVRKGIPVVSAKVRRAIDVSILVLVLAGAAAWLLLALLFFGVHPSL